MSDTLICPICGTANNAHHSSACVDIRKKGVDSQWHPDHAKAIERKWIYTPQEAIAKCNELERELADKDRQLAEARAKIDSYAEALKIANEGRGTLREAVKTLTAINDALQTERSGMRAEVEQLKQEIRDNNAMAVRQIVPAETLVDDLTAEIEQFKTLASGYQKYNKKLEDELL